MAGVLANLKVLDLTSGVAGPMTAMLLGDNGADVIKIEPPGGDPARREPGPQQLGYTVWQRGKRSAFLDLTNADDKAVLLALAKTADILVESYAPGETEKLGIDYKTLSALNPRLIYCSITGYGRGNALSDRCKGDLKIFVDLENTTPFIRDGLDLLYDKTITLKEALCGFQFDLPLLGERGQCTFVSRPGTVVTHGQQKTIPGAGFEREGCPTAGNVVITFHVQMPRQLSAETVEKLAQIAFE